MQEEGLDLKLYKNPGWVLPLLVGKGLKFQHHNNHFIKDIPISDMTYLTTQTYIIVIRDP